MEFVFVAPGDADRNLSRIMSTLVVIGYYLYLFFWGEMVEAGNLR